MSKKRPRPKRRPGRPETRTLKVDATPDGVSVELVESKCDPLDRIAPRLLRGSEELVHSGSGPSVSLLQFWKWSGSSLLDNTARGILAEFLVAHALGIDRTPRSEWEPYDMELPRDDACTVKIEVKSSARIQSWKQKKLSPIEFNIAPTRRWDPEAGKYLADRACRSADVYVFCVLCGTDIQGHIDAFDASNWCFYVLRREILDQKRPTQKKIRLNPLLGLHPRRCKLENLRETIEAAVRDETPSCST